MLQLPPYLPLFSLDATVTPETGKHDKIEIEIGEWGRAVFNREEAAHLFTRIGPPPTVSGTTRAREEHGETYGWIFNAMLFDPSQPGVKKVEADIRRSPLQIHPTNDTARELPPPLFEGSCEWKICPASIQQGATQIGLVSEQNEPDDLDCPEELLFIRAKLKLAINPTRFFRYNPTSRSSLGSREAMLKSSQPPAPYSETSLDGNDNWIPFHDTHWTSLNSSPWRNHVFRYLRAVEAAFEGELLRAGGSQNCVPNERFERAYNLKAVETYWEWLSPNPLKIVDDLVPHLRTFSNRFSGQRVYEPLEDSNIQGIKVLRIQTAPGEWLKIYAKTNLRVRIEVTHRFYKGKNQFKFPRETDTEGNVHRRSGHLFNSPSGVQTFLGRLQARAADIVNRFLQHVRQQAQVEPSHISAYNALFDVARAMPDDYPTSITLLSLLIHQGGVPSGGDQARQNGIAALRACGIIEPAGRRMYAPTAPYRHAFETLRAHANFTLLIARERTRPPAG